MLSPFSLWLNGALSHAPVKDKRKPFVMHYCFPWFRESSGAVVSPSDSVKKAKVSLLLQSSYNPRNQSQRTGCYYTSFYQHFSCSCPLQECWSIHPWRHAPQSHQCKSIISHFSSISSLFTRKTQLKKNHSNELPTTRLLLKVALWNMKRPAHPALWGMKTILMNWGRKTRNQWAQRISWAIYMTQVGLGLNKVLSDTDSKQGFVTLFNGMWVCADLLCELVWNLWPFLIRRGWFFAVVSVSFFFFFF